MKKILISLMFLSVLVSCSDREERTVKALAKRVVPEYASEFEFNHTNDTSDVFCLESMKNGKILISGNNANSMAVGLNYYLKNFCMASVSWYAGDPVEMPDTLPVIPDKIRIDAKVGTRFFLNYCTLGYTMPWWHWKDWERLIDWMALNGINMPLAITGEEAVWEKVWRKYGMNDDQIRSFFTGPAFLPWHRMINIDRWMGPLPQKWIDGQASLQKKILARERSLDMTPVLPGFSGHVPAEIAGLYPDAKITDVSTWCQFPDEDGCHFLNPSDSLFAKIEKDYISEQTEMFGTDHIYGIDLFNEVAPPSWDPETLSSMSSGVYDALKAVDKDAKWLQMGWLFVNDPVHWTEENVKAYLQAVPQGKVVMLDYFCDSQEIWKKTDSFYGQPYIFCLLTNFGGATNMEGDFHDLSARLSDSFANGGKNMIGLGSTLEGFGVNAFMYEFFFDKAWNTGISDTSWVAALADRRVGHRDPVTRQVWRTICDSIYVSGRYTRANNICLGRPKMITDGTRPEKERIAADYKLLSGVWKKMLETDSDRDTYKFDIVNIGRQALAEYFPLELYAFYDACDTKDTIAMRVHGNKMLETLADMNRLLACNRTFSLKNWDEEARSWGDTPEEKDYYEENARTIISYWGGAGVLTDYAARQWSGMVSSYYAYRWKHFVDMAVEDVGKGIPFDSVSFDRSMRTFELEWAKPSYSISYPEAGDPVSTGKSIARKMGIL